MLRTDFDLSGKTALVTGSTKGIGFAIAEGLARMGARVLINGRSPASVDEALTRLRDACPNGEFVDAPADLLNDTDLAGLTTKYPLADILVNNAGSYNRKAFFDLNDDDWIDIYKLNVLSGVRITRHYLKGMLESGWGRIVNISSESGVFIPSEMIHYGVSKAAQLAFSRGIAELTANTEVTVNSVLPGPTWVDASERLTAERALAENTTPEKIMQNTFDVRRPTSLLKRYTSPREVANMVCYICSHAASATNGAPLRVEGGIVRTFC